MVAAAHRPLVDALTKRFGPRVVTVKDVVDAQTSTAITTQDLAPPPTSEDAAREGPPPPPALARLGTALEAERAVLVDVQEKKTVVLVYPGLEGAPAVVLHVQKEKGTSLNDAWAEGVAEAVERYAAGALAYDKAKLAEKAAAASAEVRAEIEAEEARDRARRTALAAKARAEEQAHGPLVAAFVGGGGALRFLDVRGDLAPALAPVENGVVPTASLFVAAAPLRFIPGLRTSPWADALVEGGYRRGFATVKDPRAASASCPYDDDDLFVRASYRVLPVDGPWVPRVGGGVSAGVERVELGCDLPVVSTNYPNVAAFARITQPLLPRTSDGPQSPLELDVLAGGRGVLATDDVAPGAAALAVAPSWGGEAFVVARPLPFFMARVGTRITGTHLNTTGGALVVDDTRVSFDLQVGGAF